MRSLTNLSEYLKPLDDFIDTKFIPDITEGHISGWPQVMEFPEIMEKSWNFIWSGKKSWKTHYL